MEVRATGTKKFTEGDKARIRELMGPDAKRIQLASPRPRPRCAWRPPTICSTAPGSTTIGG